MEENTKASYTFVHLYQAVLNQEGHISKVYPQIDLVATPDNALVGMAQCNNCISEINARVNLFKEFAQTMGMEADMNDLFTKMYQKAMDGEPPFWQHTLHLKEKRSL